MFLKQSTSVTIKLGPFVDSTDGNTAETALTVSQADVRLSKNGGNMAQKNEATSCTHDEIGIYDCPLDATDTNTLGRLQVFVHESGALPVWASFSVLPANVYDSLFSTDKLQVHVDEMTAGIITAAVIATGAVDADALAADAAGEIADAVWDEALSGHTTAGSTGEALDDAGGAAADPWDTALPGAYASGKAGWILGNRLDAAVSSVSGNNPGAGANEFTYTLTDSLTSDPVADADVWVSTDSAGSNVVASGRTDQDGEIVFYLDSGTVYIWRQKSGWNFANPDVEVVA